MVCVLAFLGSAVKLVVVEILIAEALHRLLDLLPIQLVRYDGIRVHVNHYLVGLHLMVFQEVVNYCSIRIYEDFFHALRLRFEQSVVEGRLDECFKLIIQAKDVIDWTIFMIVSDTTTCVIFQVRICQCSHNYIYVLVFP